MFASLYFKFQHDKPHTFGILTFLPLKAILLRKNHKSISVNFCHIMISLCKLKMIMYTSSIPLYLTKSSNNHLQYNNVLLTCTME